MQQSDRPLQDIKVLVTRPKQRAAELCELINRAGGMSLPFAAIEINEPGNKRSREFAREHIDDFHIAIFISPTAVDETFDFLDRIPADIQVAAIGSRTAHALESIGRNINIIPDGHDSQALLEHPELQDHQIRGKKIVIFRGEGGRELLGDTLVSRGAEVFYADMYRRSPPSSSAMLENYLSQADIITISSNQGLQNLYDLAEDKNSLGRHKLVVPGERAYRLAITLGFSNIFVAENATDEACMNTLKYVSSEMSKKS